MCTSTEAVADALPGQFAMVIGDSTVVRSGICTSVLLVATQLVGDGDGDGDGLGDGIGLGSTVNDRVTGDETFCARSIARAENVYEPALSPLYVFGDEQLEYVPVAVPGPSSLHSNVPSSFELNSNDAVVALVGPDGPLEIIGIGGSRSTAQGGGDANADSLPAGSVAKTQA